MPVYRKPLSVNPVIHTAAWAIYVNQMEKLGYAIEFGRRTFVPESDWPRTFGGKLRIEGARIWA